MSRDDKPPPSEGPSSSSRGSSSASLSVQEVLGEIARGISGSTKGNLAVQKIVADALEAISKQIGESKTDVASQIGQQDVRHEKRLIEIQRELGESNANARALEVALKELFGVFVVRSKEERDKLDEAVEKLANTSQKFLTTKDGEVTEDSISLSGFSLRWITVWHYAKKGVPLYKYGGLFAAIGASLYKLFEGLEPYTHWFHGWFS